VLRELRIKANEKRMGFLDGNGKRKLRPIRRGETVVSEVPPGRIDIATACSSEKRPQGKPAKTTSVQKHTRGRKKPKGMREEPNGHRSCALCTLKMSALQGLHEPFAKSGGFLRGSTLYAAIGEIAGGRVGFWKSKNTKERHAKLNH